MIVANRKKHLHKTGNACTLIAVQYIQYYNIFIYLLLGGCTKRSPFLFGTSVTRLTGTIFSNSYCCTIELILFQFTARC